MRLAVCSHHFSNTVRPCPVVNVNVLLKANNQHSIPVTATFLRLMYTYCDPYALDLPSSFGHRTPLRFTPISKQAQTRDGMVDRDAYSRTGAILQYRRER